MKKIIVIVSCLVSVFANAQAVKLEWVKNVNKWSIENSKVIDASGNVYSTGSFTETVDFDPGEGVYELSCKNTRYPDIYISKLDVSGKLLWVKQIGGSGSDHGESITLSKSGYVYVTGSFDGTKDFDPGTGIFNLSVDEYKNSAFILKLDQSGEFNWAKKIGDGDLVYGKSITVDAADNVYAVGTFSGTVDFDLGEGTCNLTTKEIYGRDVSEMYVLKLNAAGNFMWAKNWWGGASDEDHSIAVDASGNVYTTGFFYGKKVDFDPGVKKLYLSSRGKKDIFISKLDSAGNFVWAKKIGSTLDDEGNSIAVDDLGSVYITGYFSKTVDFDLGKGKFELTSSDLPSYFEEKKDIFILKIKPSGNLEWAIQLGDDFSDVGNDISLDAARNIYLTGNYQGETDFDPGNGTLFLTQELNGFGNDHFMLKLNQNQK